MSKCIVCVDTEYNTPGPAYICDTCADDPTLVTTNATALGLKPSCCCQVTSVSYCPPKYIYPIGKYFDACLLQFVGHPKKLNHIKKCKEEWETKRKLKLETDAKKQQIINSVKTAAEKFCVKLDFDTNTVKDIINNQFNTLGVDDQNVTTLIIFDLNNYATLISNKDNVDALIATRIAVLDKVINDNMCGCYDPDLTNVKNKIKELPQVKTMYDGFCINDKGNTENIKMELYRIVNEVWRIYEKARQYKDELAGYGIVI